MLSFVAEELIELSVAGRTGAANAMTPNKQGAAAALGTPPLASTALPLAATATLITATAHLLSAYRPLGSLLGYSIDLDRAAGQFTVEANEKLFARSS